MSQSKSAAALLKGLATTSKIIRVAGSKTIQHRDAQSGQRGIMLNPWGTGFDLTTLIGVINRTPPGPSLVRSLLPWKPVSISTRTFAVEDYGRKLEIVEAKPWGAPPSRKGKVKRGLRGLETLHHPYQSTLTATEILAKRAIGTEMTQETIEAARDAIIEDHKTDHEQTWERYCSFALRGLVPNKDGTVLYNLFDELKAEQTVDEWNLTAGSFKFRDAVTKAKRRIERMLASQYVIRGWVAICGHGAFDVLTNRPDFEKAVERENNGQTLRDDLRPGYTFAGVRFVSYDFDEYVPANMVLLCPIISDFYLDVFSPMDSFETANRLGLPMYANAYPSLDNKTLTIDSESNQLHLAAVPEAVMEISCVLPA